MLLSRTNMPIQTATFTVRMKMRRAKRRVEQRVAEIEGVGESERGETRVGGRWAQERVKGTKGRKEPEMDYAPTEAEQREIKRRRRYFICLIIFIYLSLTNKPDKWL